MNKSKCCGYNGQVAFNNETQHALTISYDACVKCNAILTFRIQERQK